jgi:muconolactone delta-isomerase
MRFMVLGVWDPASPDIPRLLAQEQARTGELIDDGVVQQLLLRADGAGGYMIVDAESADVAHDRLRTLPFMKAGIMQIELVELK